MLKIGLTGNIASGKTVVLEFFKSYGIKCLCLDEVVHNLYKTDKSLQKALMSHFNTSKRSEISKIVFFDNKKLKTLENLIYPKIKYETEKFFISNAGEKLTVVSAALLFEKQFDTYFDKIIFVSANEKLRLLRLQKRSGLTETEASARINSQETEEKKIPKADFVIYNNSTLSELEEQCKKITGVLNSLL